VSEQDIVSELQFSRKLPCEVQNEMTKEVGVFASQLVQGPSWQRDQFAVLGCDERGCIVDHGQERCFPKTVPDGKFPFPDGNVFIGDQQVDFATLDDVDVRRFVASPRHVFARLEMTDFQNTENLAALNLRNTP